MLKGFNSSNISIAKLSAFAFFMLTMFVITMPDLSYAVGTADSSGSIASTLCSIVSSLTGVWGKAIATIAIIVLGIGLFLGKLSWGIAIATAIGIGMIFGAGTIVTWLAPTATATC
jgi:type IV secretion system protein VirB2